MNNDLEEQKKFLEAQLKWAREQDRILAEMEEKLYEMKAIAEYAAAHELSTDEHERLNHLISDIKNDVDALEDKLRTEVH